MPRQNTLPKGINKEIVEYISKEKKEPRWMREFRLKSLFIFESMPMPSFGPDLSRLDLQNITYYVKYSADSNNKLPQDLQDTYNKLGIPEAEQKFLAGLVTQYESEALYKSIRKEWTKKGVIFCGLDEAVQKYPKIVQQYFMTKCVPPADNKFSALHGAVWSGGTYIYVPKGVHVSAPLQTYFFMHSKEFGQFEHTLIIAEEGSSVSYIEGCSAPRYNAHSLHSAVVEVFVNKNAAVNYISIQNWSKDIYNLNTKRALVDEYGKMGWTNGSFGAGVSMLYPSSILVGRGAQSKYRGISIAACGQIKDGGSKAIHLAPETKSEIFSKSISIYGGETSFRGLIKVKKGAAGSKAKMRCESLIMDSKSKASAEPKIDIQEPDVVVTHEASTGKLEDSQIFYLQLRGLSKKEAESILIHGFFEPIIKDMSLEYAVELDKLIDLELEGAA